MANRGSAPRPNGASQGKICQFKLVLLGESAVGKSSLVLRFVKGQFHEYQESTIGGNVLSSTLHHANHLFIIQLLSLLKPYAWMILLLNLKFGTLRAKKDTIVQHQCIIGVHKQQSSFTTLQTRFVILCLFKPYNIFNFLFSFFKTGYIQSCKNMDKRVATSSKP